MRTIKFRAKRQEDAKWIYGDVFTDIYNDDMYIHEVSLESAGEVFLADKTTIGQFTGLHDKNGRGVYEGDILSVKEPGGNYSEPVVEWSPKGYWAVNHGSNELVILGFVNPEQLEVISNIHTTPLI